MSPSASRQELPTMIGVLVGGDYEIERQIGRGGMGTVYVARQLSTGKQRALKLMRVELLFTDGSQTRFAEEARLAARVDSEHVVQVVAAGFDAALEVPWIAMELLSGQSLAEHLARSRPLAAPEVVEILRGVCRGLSAAHRAGLVHRDLKPENIYLARHPDEPGRAVAKLLDFGIAKLLHATGAAASTSAMGSPAWIAPEQANGEPVSAVTDLWALGLLAFQMLVGAPFWKAAQAEGTLQGLLTEILLKPIPSAAARARELGRSLPPEFDAWFSRTVVRDPAARFGDALAAFAALEEALGVVATGKLRLSPPLGDGPSVVIRSASSGPASQARPSRFDAPTAKAHALEGSPAARSTPRARLLGALLLVPTLLGLGWYAYARSSHARASPAAVTAGATGAPLAEATGVTSVAQVAPVSPSAPPRESASAPSAAPNRLHTAAAAPMRLAPSATPAATKVSSDPWLLTRARSCVETPSGPVTVTVTLRPDGVPASVHVAGDIPLTARQCIVQAASEHRFPGPSTVVTASF